MVASGRAGIAVARIAAAIGEPARARILYCLMDGRGRTSTELAIVADVTPSTASVHLGRLKAENLIRVLAQGKHRFYSLRSPEVADVLEGLCVLAGASRTDFVTNTPPHLRAARTCYDHLAGALGVSLHDRLETLGWLTVQSKAGDGTYDLTPTGIEALEAFGIDVGAIRTLRRRFACACLDWSERRPHVGGALGAALLQLAFRRDWVNRDLDSRALRITRLGRREMSARLGMRV